MPALNLAAMKSLLFFSFLAILTSTINSQLHSPSDKQTSSNEQLAKFPQTTDHVFHNDTQKILYLDYLGNLSIPLLEGRTSVAIDVPSDQSIRSWVQRMTLTNAPTMYLPEDARPDTATRTVYVAKATEVVCWTNATHTATLFANPKVTGLWTTHITFTKTYQGFACGNHPPYPSSISRCMARFTTPWIFPFTEKLGGTTTSTWTITVPGPHFGNAEPARWVNDSSSADSNWPCHDEVSCHNVCEIQARAGIKGAIIAGSILGATLLLFPIAYFAKQPHHLRKLRRKAKLRNSHAIETPAADYAGRTHR